MEDQELLDLLYEAYQKGAGQEDLNKIRTWYSGQKKDSTTVGHEFKQPTTGGLPEGLAVRPQTKKDDTGAIVTLAKQVHSGFADRLPEMYYAGKAMDNQSTSNFEQHIAAKYKNESLKYVEDIANKAGGFYTDDDNKKYEVRPESKQKTPIGLEFRQPGKTVPEDVLLKAANAYYKTIVGDAQYNKEKLEFEKTKTGRTVDYLNKAEEQAKEGQQRTGGLINSYKDVENTGDAIRYVASSLGESVAPMAASIATGTGGAFMMEQADSYRENLQMIANKLSETTGVEVTPQQVVELGFDKPAIDQAKLTGAVNGTIEALGTLLGPGGKILTRAFRKKAVQEITKKGLTRNFIEGTTSEGLTEFIQESSTQYGALIASGLTPEEALEKIDWERSFEAGVKGGIAGGTFSAIAGGGSEKPKGPTAKVIEQEETANKEAEKSKVKVAEQVAELEAKSKLADDVIEDETVAPVEDLSDITRLSEDIKNIQKDKIIAEETKDLVKEQEKLTETKDKLAEKSFKEAIIDEEKLESEKAKGTTKKVAKPKKEASVSTSPSEIKEPTIDEEQKIETGPQQSTVKAEEKVEPTRRRRVPKTSKIIKEDETKINLESGEVTEIKPRRGRQTKKQEEGSNTGVQRELPVEPVKKSPNPQATQIEDEKVKLRNRFESIKKLPRKQLVEERLTKLIEKDIPSSIDPTSHQEVLDAATKELVKIKELRSAKAENVVKNKEKAKSKKEAVKEEVAAVQDNTKEIETLEEEKKSIIDKYGELRSKSGQVLRRATPQVDDKGKQLWEQKDLDRIREINEGIKALRSPVKKRTPEQDVKAQSLKDQGLDDDSVIDTIIDPDDVFEITSDDLNIQNTDIEERVSRDYKDFEEVDVESYTQELSNVSPVFKNIVEAQLQIIRQAVRGNKNFRIFKTSTDKKTIGEAIRDGKNFIILLNKNVPITEYTKQHEFNHIFEFAVNQLEAGSDIWLSKSWRDINKIFDDLKTHLEKMNAQEKKIFDALYPKDNNIYGLKNAREMVAESMVNPKFAALLASLKTTYKGKKVSVLEKLYNAVIDFVNSVIDTYKFKIPKIQSLDSTYLGRIIDVFESTLKEIKDVDFSSKELNEIAKAAFEGEDPTYLSADEKAKNNKTTKMAERIMDTAHARKIEDLGAFRKFLKDVQNSLGQDFDRGLKAALTRRFNTYLHYKYMVTHKDDVMKELYRSGKNIEPAFKSIVDDVKEIKIDQSTVASINKWGRILQELNIGSNEMFAKHKTAVQKEAAKQRTDAIVKVAPKSGFRRITSLINNKMNLQTFLGAISKQAPEVKKIMYDTFAKPLLEAHRSATLEANKIMQEELLPIIQKNKLQTSNLQRIHFFGVLQRFSDRIGNTIEERVEKERTALQNKLMAAQKYDKNRLKVSEVTREIQVMEEVGANLLSGVDVLSVAEKEYFDKQQFILNSLKDVVKSTKEIVWGQEFKEDKGLYAPTSALGSVPVGSQAFQDLRSSEGQQLIDMLENQTFIDENVYASQTGHSLQKTGGRGTYYDNNAHTVMSKYLHSILFDAYGSYDIQKLNKMFHGFNRNKLDEAVGIDNMNVIFDAEKRAVRRALRPSIDYSKLGKIFVKAQQFLQTAKIGTMGQFFTQYVGMLPATATITSVPATYKALEFQLEMVRNPELRTKFQEAVETSSADLAIRDFWWEKYESAEDRAKDDLGTKVERLQETVDKSFVTKIMSVSDKGAAQLTWIASMIEQGADIKKPETWTQSQVTSADMKTTQLQNSSSTLYLPKALERDSEQAMLFASILYSFKSFQLNAMMNLIANVPDAFSQPQARKTIAALAVSALGYEMAALGVMKAYTVVGLTLAAALGYDVPDEDKKKKEPAASTKVLTNSFYNLLFGGFSNPTDSVWRYIINESMIPFLVGDFDRKGKLKYNKAEQSPLYGPTNVEQTFYKSFGVFSGMVENTFGYGKVAFDELKGKEVSEARESKHFDNLIGDAISMAPLLPFRGDIAKIWNSANREISKRERRRKPKSKRSRKRWNS